MGPLEVAVTEMCGHAALRERNLEPYQPARLDVNGRKKILSFPNALSEMLSEESRKCLIVDQRSIRVRTSHALDKRQGC
jgi:hypothetical protein